MRRHLVFYLNGERCEVGGDEVFLPLATWLRETRRLTGTKVVCAEGDCGACSVLVGSVATTGLQYRAIDSCIAFLWQLDGTHVVTVEGLARREALHPIQRAMVEGYGSQCGFCTPGFVTTLTALAEQARQEGGRLDERRLRRGLSGNLCRCTGYLQILEAMRSLDLASVSPLSVLFPDDELADELRAPSREPVWIETADRTLYLAEDLMAAATFRAEHEGCTVVSGATDVGVTFNKERVDPRRILGRHVLALSGRIPDFASCRIDDGLLQLGAGATWSAVLDLVRDPIPQLAHILELFGAPQIRNLGTVGGNLVNASPIADALPFFSVLEAELEIVSPQGARRVKIDDFSLGYRDVDLRHDELLAAIEAPLPRPDQQLFLYKYSKRRDLDISSVSAAVLLGTGDGGEDGGEVISGARIAFGGVAETVVRLPAVESALVGQPLSAATFDAAGVIARDAITPIRDVRGGEAYRRQLVENTLRRIPTELCERRSSTVAPSTTSVWGG